MMSLYYMTPQTRQLARRRMWEQLLDAKAADENYQVVFPVDVIVRDDDYTLSAFLPGVNADNLNIEIIDDTVTIEGEIDIQRDENDHYLLAERPSGKFRRVITLPDAVDADKTDAELQNGVLTLTIPKSELARPRKIKISNN
jgi:HSP20 family protein